MENSNREAILIVDDDALVRNSLKRLLSEHYRVVVVASVGEAVAILEQTRFDILLTDYDMPGENGYQLLDLVWESHPEIRRILFSGRNPPEVQQKLDTGLIDAFIAKPFGPEELLSELRRARKTRV